VRRPAWRGLVEIVRDPVTGRTCRKAPIVCGRKHCTRCGRWRLLLDFHPRERNAEGEAIAWQAMCKACSRQSERVSKGNRMRGRPYEVWSPRITVEERRRRQREHWRKVKADPKKLELRREYGRIWAEGKRRERGVPVRQFRNRRTVIDRVERVFLPREPLLAELKLWKDAEGTFEGLARLSGVSARTIYRYRYGESAHIRIDVADRIAYALGIPSSVLFGEAWQNEREAA
jgi:transcriptional regulator with XRE-family HTH domain